MRRIAVFLVKLSAAMSVDHYDQITKAVYVGAMQAERNGYAIAGDRPKSEAMKPIGLFQALRLS